jgi:hypothetical protein
MLITERTSNGRTIVRLHKTWHPQKALGVPKLPDFVYRRQQAEAKGTS